MLRILIFETVTPIFTPKPLDGLAPELFESHGLRQMIDIPTRITNDTTSLIDLVYCRNFYNITSHGTLPQIADHAATFVSFNCHKEKPKLKTKKVFDYKNIDEKALLDHIKSVDFESLIFSKPVKEQADARLLLRKKNRNYAFFKKIKIRARNPKPEYC